jgi:hypothetical protein
MSAHFCNEIVHYELEKKRLPRRRPTRQRTSRETGDFTRSLLFGGWMMVIACFLVVSC